MIHCRAFRVVSGGRSGIARRTKIVLRVRVTLIGIGLVILILRRAIGVGMILILRTRLILWMRLRNAWLSLRRAVVVDLLRAECTGEREATG